MGRSIRRLEELVAELDLEHEVAGSGQPDDVERVRDALILEWPRLSFAIKELLAYARVDADQPIVLRGVAAAREMLARIDTDERSHLFHRPMTARSWRNR